VVQRPNIGMLVSGLGHAGVLGWLFFGPGFSAEPLPFEDVEVSIISGEEFAALLQPEETAPVVEPAPAVEPPTAPEPVPEPVQPVPEEPVAEPVQPPQEPPSEPDPAPDTSQITPLPQTEVEPDAPVDPEPPVTSEQEILLPETSLRPKARPSDRIAPQAVAPSEPEVEVAPDVQEAVAQDAQGTDVAEAQDATAPEEAATEIVTEAETPSGAPETSLRPKTRPNRPALTQTAETTPNEDTSVASALEQALAGAVDAEPQAPTGPPLTRGEKDALVVAVGNCWNVGSLSTDALNVTVTIGFSMEQDAKPVSRSIRLIVSEGGSGDAVQRAFDAARRAVLRCGARGYGLPVEKYEQWKEIEITFNPERMRIK